MKVLICICHQAIKIDKGLDDDHFEFIRDNCAPYLKYLKLDIRLRPVYLSILDGVSNQWSYDGGQIIKSQLKHIQKLHLNEVWFRNGPQTLLKHCENLQEFTIQLDPNLLSAKLLLETPNGKQLLGNQVYPKLTTLKLDINSGFDFDLREFFRFNTSLKSVECASASNLSVIKTMMDADNALRDVTLHFWWPAVFQAAQSDFQKWVNSDSRQNIETQI